MRATGRIGVLALGAGMLVLAGCAPDGERARISTDTLALTHALYAVPGVLTSAAELPAGSDGDVTVKLEPGLTLDEQLATAVRVQRTVRASDRFGESALTIFVDHPTSNPSGSFIRWRANDPVDETQLITDVRLWQDLRSAVPADYLFFEAGDGRSLDVRQLVVPGATVAEPEALVALYARAGAGEIDIEVVP